MDDSTLLLLIASVISLLLAQQTAALQSNVPASQRNALQQIFNALNGSNWPANQQWNASTDPCSTWYPPSHLLSLVVTEGNQYTMSPSLDLGTCIHYM